MLGIRGNTQDMYQTINRWIEDDYGLPQSYRRQVNIITMDIVTSIPLLSFTFSNLQGRTTTYNNMSTTSMPVRIKIFI